MVPCVRTTQLWPLRPWRSQRKMYVVSLIYRSALRLRIRRIVRSRVFNKWPRPASHRSPWSPQSGVRKLSPAMLSPLRRPEPGLCSLGLLRFPRHQPDEKALACQAGVGGTWGVPYVELGRRDVHHDGWACRLCCVLHCAALDGVTLSTFRPLR